MTLAQFELLKSLLLMKVVPSLVHSPFTFTAVPQLFEYIFEYVKVACWSLMFDQL